MNFQTNIVQNEPYSKNTEKKKSEINTNTCAAFLLAAGLKYKNKDKLYFLGGSIPNTRRGPRPKRYDLLKHDAKTEKIMKRHIKRGMVDRAVNVNAIMKNVTEERHQNSLSKDNLITYNEFMAMLDARFKYKYTDRSIVKNSAYHLIKSIQSKNVKNPEIEILLLDTSYINSIVAECESIRSAIIGLREAIKNKSKVDVEVVLTREVYNELLNQLKGANGPKKDEYGRQIITSKAINELHELIGEGTICLEEYTADEDMHKEFSVILKKRNKKGNRRIGKGEISILKYIKEMINGLANVSFRILTLDSDIFKLLRGCEGIIKVAKVINRKRKRVKD